MIFSVRSINTLNHSRRSGVRLADDREISVMKMWTKSGRCSYWSRKYFTMDPEFFLHRSGRIAALVHHGKEALPPFRNDGIEQICFVLEVVVHSPYEMFVAFDMSVMRAWWKPFSRITAHAASKMIATLSFFAFSCAWGSAACAGNISY